ncbi:hypothetical protein ACC782_33520 [Rhizobium ruizarguesonis]
MVSMIERVAQAIYAKNAAAAAGRLPWAKAQDATKEGVRELARAAIGEMRVPTTVMIADGSRQRPFNEDDTDYDGFAYRENTEGTWQAMIDAALKEETP